MNLNRAIRIRATIVALLPALLILGCSDDDPVDPGDAPVASFTMNSGLVEGDTLRLTNTSTGATSYVWSVNDIDSASTEENPTFVLLDEGDYTVRLIAVGPGGSDTTEQTATVGISREFRAFGDGEKTFYVHELLLDGNAVSDDPCYWDNTFVVRVSDSTFAYADNTNVCPSAPLPDQSGTFRVIGDVESIELNVTVPFTTTILYEVETLTRDSVVLSATLTSGTTARLTGVTTQRTQ